MVNRFSKEGQDLIYNDDTVHHIKKYINEGWGHNFRTYPYDLNNPNDLLELINTSLLECLDISYYLYISETMCESMDETLLTYKTDLYSNMYGSVPPKPSPVHNPYISIFNNINMFLENLYKYRASLIDDLKFLFEESNKGVYYSFWGFPKTTFPKGPFLNNLKSYCDKFMDKNIKNYKPCNQCNIDNFTSFVRKELDG